MFSQKVEYALRAVAYLASKPGGARTVEQIAKATKVPQAYLAKVIQELVHAGVARSQRGSGHVLDLQMPCGVIGSGRVRPLHRFVVIGREQPHRRAVDQGCFAPLGLRAIQQFGEGQLEQGLQVFHAPGLGANGPGFAPR